MKKHCPDQSSYLRQSSDELRAPMRRRERGARADNETKGAGGRGPKEERRGRRRGWDSRVLWQTRRRTVKLSREATKSRHDEIRFISVIFLLFVNETCGGSRGRLNLRWWHPWWLLKQRKKLTQLILPLYRYHNVLSKCEYNLHTHWKITQTSSLHSFVTSRLLKFSLSVSQCHHRWILPTANSLMQPQLCVIMEKENYPEKNVSRNDIKCERVKITFYATR